MARVIVFVSIWQPLSNSFPSDGGGTTIEVRGAAKAFQASAPLYSQRYARNGGGKMSRLLTYVLGCLLIAAGTGRSVSLVSKSNGLEVPQKEGGNTEVEVADIDADGHLDLISVGDHGSPYVNSDQHGIMVWFGDGVSSWSVVQTGEFGYGGCAVGDLNLDGYMDVAWGVHHGWGTGGFGDTLMGAALGDGSASSWDPWDDGLCSTGETWGMFATDLADFDLDGDLDIVCESFGSGNGVRLYENNMDGTWSYAWMVDGGNAGSTIESGDFDADGCMDFVCTRWGTQIYFGDGEMGFTLNQAGIPDQDMVAVDCGDYNGDGRDDVVCSFGSDSGVHCYYYDDGSGQWIDGSTGLPSGGAYYDLVQFGYIDGDSNLDLVIYDDPTGEVYLGDGSGNWTADATWTMPSSGDASALRIDGDVDHDGREDIVIEGEESGGMFDRNQLRVYSPYSMPGQLSTDVISPDGGETLVEWSVREIRWLTAVPPLQGQAEIDLYLSMDGSGGPWTEIAGNLPDKGSYQWTVHGDGYSSTCRIKVVATSSYGSTEAISDADFTITGNTGVSPEHGARTEELAISVVPNPCKGTPVIRLESPSGEPVVVKVFDLTGREVGSVGLNGGSYGPIPLEGFELSPGIYLVRASTADRTTTTRLVQL
ncbi:T9SS type A sorting domain-containing protein [Candidatus Fermentibacteria bacterium]|nr:T9SS type A sorting domain-containing protein [Candidatus Fermentibacteria bacterium]